ncbi:hypothetical protein Dimus_000367, partial [Dionaea muscipula]
MRVEEKFYDAEDENQGSQEEQEEISVTTHTVRLDDENGVLGVDPRVNREEVDFTKFKQNLKERGQTNFMRIWRRP